MRRPDSANIKATGGWSSSKKEPKGRFKTKMARRNEVRFREVGNYKWTKRSVRS